jgi:peptidoglycan-associated lipoprotein
MKATTRLMSAIAVVGILLLISQGCSTKWLQSEGNTQSGQSAAKKDGEGSAFPNVSGGGTTNELSGFSHSPSEERVSQGGITASLSPSDPNVRRRAELTREERAALEAGIQDVFFGYDQWTLSETGMQSLSHDAEWLKEHAGATMQIEGHCDERGTSDYNIVLGDKRAKAARGYLIELGISPKQLTTVSYGKERPFCLERSESCYQQNRRGHMLLRANKK